MQDFEKLGLFYLGRMYDIAGGKALPDLCLYDAKDLTTHAVCVGMTGSGKTGLCLTLLEEAAIDGIPAIIIDPKGDLGNLLLTFPELRAQDFEPWVDPGEAARKGLAVGDYAAQVAETAKKGLAEWGQEGARIAKFRSSVDLAIYTPGGNAGLPLRALQSFTAPPQAVIDDADDMRQRVLSTVSGLLALLGIDADPVRSREHILLSQLIDRAWRAGRDLDLPSLIREIQSPGIDKIGVLDLESFFPAKDRFDLAMTLNNVLASPGFAAWREGEPLDAGKLLYTAEGRPRLSIISIAHLSDAERMFFVTLLLNEVVAWMRGQSGTSSLRAILYMDEVFGYFPPSANPPSKLPLLTLMKQARAYGLGVVLATQNPVDLDYKGLSNAGTWFLGRLQTERDKARVLDGLEGASAAAGAAFDRATMERALSSLGNRIFLMNNVHDDAPVVFQTRWALSYLRGPLTKSQIQALMSERKAQSVTLATSPKPGAAAASSAEFTKAESAPATVPTGHDRPILPPGIDESFLPLRKTVTAGLQVRYQPALLGQARLHFVSAKDGVDEWQEAALLASFGESVPAEVWQETDELDGTLEFDTQPAASAAFDSLPSELTKAANYKSWKSSLKDALYRARPLELWSCGAVGEVSKPGEKEADFRIRLTQRAREARDLEVEKLRKKFLPKIERLQERIRQAEQRVEREKSQATQQTISAAVSFGSSILGALFGRKIASATNVSRAGSSMRAAGRAAQQRGDVSRAEESVEVLEKELKDADAELAEEIAKLDESLQPANLALEAKSIPPRKSDLTVSRVALVWTPWLVDANGRRERGW